MGQAGLGGAPYKEVRRMSEFPIPLLIKLRLSAWRRRRVKRKYRRLFQASSMILFKHDPIGISFGDNTDEYDPEVGTILPRMSGCASAEDVRRVVYEEFQKWFTPEVTGDEIGYDAIARELWMLWSSPLRHDDS
jgi:hypothetical protein